MTNFNISLLQIGAKLYHKLGNFLLQIGAAFFITNWDKCYYKLGQLNYYKSGQLLQIRATVITNWDSYYKLGQTLLQIRAAITNWSNYYKLGHNIAHLKKLYTSS